jgi:hypothetical protein
MNMKERELKYMGNSIKYKEVEIPNKTDNYGRPLVVKVAKQSDAEQVTDEKTGVKRWTGGAFFDMMLNGYIKDEEYEELDDEKLIALANKLKK